MCAYAVISNHSHIVLYVDDIKSKRLSDNAIIIRWHKLFKGSILSLKSLQGERLDSAQQHFLNKDIEQFRERLSSISWFMCVLNEDIARQANREDNCTGRFGEERFKSQALLDEFHWQPVWCMLI